MRSNAYIKVAAEHMPDQLLDHSLPTYYHHTGCRKQVRGELTQSAPATNSLPHNTCVEWQLHKYFDTNRKSWRNSLGRMSTFLGQIRKSITSLGSKHISYSLCSNRLMINHCGQNSPFKMLPLTSLTLLSKLLFSKFQHPNQDCS